MVLAESFHLGRMTSAKDQLINKISDTSSTEGADWGWGEWARQLRYNKALNPNFSHQEKIKELNPSLLLYHRVDLDYTEQKNNPHFQGVFC